MSTLDPGIEPPGDWQPPYAPPPPRGRTEATDRAAVYVWLCAGLCLALACCCGMSVVGMTMLPTSEIMSQIPADMPNRDQIQQLLPVMAVVMGIVAVVFLLIPGIVLAILGFPIRAGGRPSAITAMIILGIQALVLGLITLMNLLGVIISRSLGDLIGVFILAGVVALFVLALSALWASLRSPTQTSTQTVEPWGY